MGNYCYQEQVNESDLFFRKNEIKLTEDLRKTIESICFKKNHERKLKDDDDIMQNYKIIKILGTGLFSNVYLVQDHQKDLFALKIIKKRKFVTKESIQKILVEKEILKILDHQNILKLHKTFQSKNRLYFLLEYASRGNLLRILNIKMKFNTHEIKVIAAQIIEALLYIHSKGIIYGDLKAENVLMNEKGLVKLCDFNLSGTRSLLNDSLQGTVCYLAPEIIQGKERTHKSDFWSLGVLLHLLFYRKFPFKNKNQTELFFNILNRNIEQEDRNKAPNSLRKLILDLLKKCPKDRLGNNFKEFIYHPFFKGFDWKNYKDLYNEDFIRELTCYNDNEDDNLMDTFQKNTLQHTPGDKFYYDIQEFTYEKRKSDSSKKFSEEVINEENESFPNVH